MLGQNIQYVLTIPNYINLFIKPNISMCLGEIVDSLGDVMLGLGDQMLALVSMATKYQINKIKLNKHIRTSSLFFNTMVLQLVLSFYWIE